MTDEQARELEVRAALFAADRVGVPALAAEWRRLRDAIRTHRAQKADDRCIEDDDRLYEALGDGVKCDRRVGDKAAMRANCDRFIDRRCEAGGWPSYVELEAEVTRLKGDLALAETRAAEETAKRVNLELRREAFGVAKTLGLLVWGFLMGLMWR